MKNICLLHGWGANISKLVGLKNELAALGWRVYVPELPFFDAPEPNRPWNLQDYAEYVNQGCQLEFRKAGYYLFGHSLGGRIALKLAAQKTPQLMGIILCATAGISRDCWLKRVIFLGLSKIIKPTPALRRLAYKLARNHDYEQITSVNKKATFRNIIEEDAKKYLQQITVPTLILWGEQDHLTPIKDANYLYQNISNTHLKTYPNQTHRLPYQLPQALALEINSWSQQ